MPEHYTKNTLECTAWCETCGRQTKHAVSDGRRGRCLEHESPQYSKKQLARRERLARENRNPTLF